MKKWKIILLIALLLPFVIITRVLPIYNSYVYRDSRSKAEEAVQNMPQILLSLLEAEGEEMQRMAERVVSLREEDHIIASYVLPTKQFSAACPPGRKDLLQTKIPAIQKELQNFENKADLLLYSIFSPMDDLFYYPKESCVFRYHLMHDGDVYYQVDLIFSPYWDEFKQDYPIRDPFGKDLSTEIAEDWYAVILMPR